MASWKYTKDSNLGTVTLGSGYTSGSGSMTLTTGHGARLPSSGDFWLANNTAGTIRIFKVTARSTDTLTVTAVASEGAGDGNLSNGATLVPVISADAVDQLKADIVASGGLVLVEQHTASASASLDFTSFISSTYDSYVFDFVNVLPSTDNTYFYMRASTDGGSSYISTGTYTYSNYIWRIGGSGAGGSSGATQLDLLFNNVDSDSTRPGVTGALKLANPGGSVYKYLSGQFTFFGEGSTYLEGCIFVGSINTATAVNAVQFFFSSGNIASGTIRVYGIAK